MGIRVTMDFFQHRYYRTNKILLSIVGQWPYQTANFGRGFFTLTFFIAVSHIIPQIIAVVEYRHDWEILLECALPMIFNAGLVTKAFSSKWNSQKMLKLLDRIRADWKVWARDREVNILHEYAEQGRKMTIAYAMALYPTGILFAMQPIVPKIIDVLLKNGSESGEFPIPVDYYRLDGQKYYFYIVTYSTVTITVLFLFLIAYHTMFIVYVQHGCGIFAALGPELIGSFEWKLDSQQKKESLDLTIAVVSLTCTKAIKNFSEAKTHKIFAAIHKLERIGKDEKLTEAGKTANALDKRNTDFEHLVWCIDRHNDAIEYAELIESTYSWCFLFIMGCNMLIISITGLQIVRKTIYCQESTRFIVCNMAATVHLYIENHMSQILMDHSINIRYYIHNGKWYKLSLKAQKTVYLMMMRCNVACKLTAGKISIMCVETFAMIVKTSLSCLTVLRSI